ncbi:hypothetical protein PR048_017584 [Dryococelus australis]|uniref:Uncharacterized protein n=1 Tax=Dryococelus australis TaxID=614101 RepID=A0ABQ9HA40_9NEOP|nr:hypothetical protein PR048_017584 [Dryococelus australis]
MTKRKQCQPPPSHRPPPHHPLVDVRVEGPPVQSGHAHRGDDHKRIKHARGTEYTRTQRGLEAQIPEECVVVCYPPPRARLETNENVPKPLWKQGVAVAERLARSPPTKTKRLVGGSSQGSPASPAPSFRRPSIFTSITLIGSQDLAFKSRPNLFTHSYRNFLKIKIFFWGGLKKEARGGGGGELGWRHHVTRSVRMAGATFQRAARSSNNTTCSWELQSSVTRAGPLQADCPRPSLATLHTGDGDVSTHPSYPDHVVTALRAEFATGPGGVVVRLLDFPPRQIGFDFRRGHSRIFTRGNRAGRSRRSAGFLVVDPLIPALLHTHLASPSSALKALISRAPPPPSNFFTRSFKDVPSAVSRVLGSRALANTAVAVGCCVLHPPVRLPDTIKRKGKFALMKIILGNVSKISRKNVVAGPSLAQGGRTETGEGLASQSQGSNSVTDNYSLRACKENRPVLPEVFTQEYVMRQRHVRSNRRPLRRTRFSFPARSALDFRVWGLCRTMPQVSGIFSGISRFPRPCILALLHAQLAYPHIDSQDLDVKNDPGSIHGRVTPDFRTWESCRTMPLVGGFSRGSPVSLTLSIRRCSISISITLIGSQDLDVKSRSKYLHSSPPQQCSVCCQQRLVELQQGFRTYYITGFRRDATRTRTQPLRSRRSGSTCRRAGRGSSATLTQLVTGLQQRAVRSTPVSSRPNARYPLAGHARSSAAVGLAARSLALHHENRTGSVREVSPRFSHVGIVPDDSTRRRVFPGDLPFLPPLHSSADFHSSSFTLIFKLEKLGSDKGYIATQRKALNWRAVFSSHCVYLWVGLSVAYPDGQPRDSLSEEDGNMKSWPRESLLKILAALNNEVLRDDERETRREWSSARMRRRQKREIPEKTRRPST